MLHKMQSSHLIAPLQRIRSYRFSGSLLLLLIAGMLGAAAPSALAASQATAAATSFGSVSVGTTAAAPLTVTFTFNGTPSLVGSVDVVTQGATGLDYANAGGGSCAAGSYGPGATCTVNVSFTAKFAGTRQGAVLLKDINGNPIATAYLTGTGVAPHSAFVSGTQTPVASGFGKPAGIAVDGSGNIYVADSAANAVYKEVPSSGGYTQSTIGSGFGKVIGVAVDGAGNVYVVDQYSVIYVFTLQGDYSYAQTSTLSGGALNQPNGLTVDGAGNIFVANTGGGDVVELIPASNGNYLQVVINQGGFVTPVGVAVDGSGNVYVSDNASTGGTKTVYKLTSPVSSAPGEVQYTKTAITGASFTNPGDIAIDAAGTVYVGDDALGGAGFLAMLTPKAGGGYNTLKPFGGVNPSAVAVDASGNVYIADDKANSAYELNLSVAPSLVFVPTLQNATSSDSSQTVTIINNGNTALNFSAVSFPTDFPAGTASFCHSSSSLTAATSCALAVNFTPISPLSAPSAALSESVSVTTNSLNVAPTVQSIFVSGTEQNIVGIPNLIAPAAGSTLGTNNVTFSWTPGTATGYNLLLSAIGYGSSDLLNTGAITATSVTVPTLPANGVTVYARLYYLEAGTWLHIDIATFKESGTSVAATITSPVAGSVLLSTNQVFTWNPGVGATQFEIKLGTTGKGSINLYNGTQTSANSLTVPTIPMNGATIYATFLFRMNGVEQTVYSTYQEPLNPTWIAPAKGSTLGTSNVTFSWNPGTATGFNLLLSTIGIGSSELLNTGAITADSVTLPTLPADGVDLYARLFYLQGGVWQHMDLPTFKESGSSTPPAMISPAPGSTLTGSTATFTWNPGKGASEFELFLGTKKGTSDLYQGGQILGTSATVGGIPTTGATVYATLIYRLNDVEQYLYYTYTEK